jgi:PIN domain nuclease of toxin-antitoxin system
MTFLDTHAIIFLYADQKRIPMAVWPFLDATELSISPMARLELDFLFEIGRITEDPRTIIAGLERDYHLTLETDGWSRAAEVAATLSWTRDPFDRLISAHALVWGEPLLTKDRSIREHYRHAFWEEPPDKV